MNDTLKSKLENYRKFFKERGCRAKTVKGLVRFWKKWMCGWIRGNYLGIQINYSKQSAHDWKQQEEKRKSYPESKRAIKDQAFRSKWLRRLRDEYKRLNREPRNAEEVTQMCRTSKDRNIRMNEVNRELHAGKAKTLNYKSQATRKYALIEGGEHLVDVQDIRNLGVNIRRGRQWRLGCGFDNYVVTDIDAQSGHNGRHFYTIQAADHLAHMRCFGYVISPSCMEFAYLDKITKYTAPENCAWGTDSNGIYLKMGPDEHHVFAQELLDPLWVERIKNNIKRQAEQRKKIAAEMLAAKADAEGVMVCLADSLKGGNCMAGTLAFGAKHNLNPRMHYPATDILDMCNGDLPRARLAIHVAAVRTKEENARGYSILEEHGVLNK